MITVKNITKNILGEPLFKDVSFVLHPGDKVGLVGQNGSGKSSLMKLILGLDEPDAGTIAVEHERIGYLPQDPQFEPEATVETFLKATHANTERVLKRVGLEKIKQETHVAGLSGGQKTRLALARILLQNPTALFLDEPTNHIDTQGLLWLEEFIKDFKGIVFVISHDRTLLDTSVQRILEIDSANHIFSEFHGGYSAYKEEKKRRLEVQEGAYYRQQKKKEHMELWLALKKQEARAHPDPAKGKQIRAMEKRLEREVYSQEIQRPHDEKVMKGLELVGNSHAGKLIARCTDITKSFESQTILTKVNFEIRGTDRILLSGENGSGKTTLLKIIAGEIIPDSGMVKIGENVKFGYFAQEHEHLDPDKTVLEEFAVTDRLCHHEKDPRTILGAFHFHGQDVFKRVRDLSAGERVRLIFAKLTHQKNDFLILDEPTNHLDIASREIIEDSLIDYAGAIIAVSHDRYFIERIGFEKVIQLVRGSVR